MPYICPFCGGIYEIDVNSDFKLGHIDDTLPGIWRYRSVFGIPQTAPVTYLGEGDTPIIWRKAFSKDIIFKLEFLNPTGSYKDRATAVLTSMLKQRNVSHAIEDSSGNAGASFAAYASAFDIDAEIYIPASTSGP
ncbi:MAG: pyridoxal-phosphate dependent enzyme, partial [Chloroflexota bacterium]